MRSWLETLDVHRPLVTDRVRTDRHERADRVDLPEKVDVVVTETMGNFGVDEGILAASIDARTRFLRDGGVIVPRAIELVVVPVEVPDDHVRYIDCWADDLGGVDFSSVRSIAANSMYATVLGPAAFLADPVSLTRVRLLDVEKPEIHGEIAWTARRRGTLHGCGGWFAADLAPGIELSNAPPLSTPNWGNAFFPLERPVPLETGDRVNIAISAVANGTVWMWRITVGEKVVGDHSTRWGIPRLRAELRRVASDQTPALTPRGHAELDILRLLDGRTTIGAIREELLRSHPDVFRSRQDVSMFVQDAVNRCGA